MNIVTESKYPTNKTYVIANLSDITTLVGKLNFARR